MLIEIQKPKYQINEKVLVRGSSTPRVVVAAYRIEIWYVYQLQGQEDFFTKETRLDPYQPTTQEKTL